MNWSGKVPPYLNAASGSIVYPGSFSTSGNVVNVNRFLRSSSSDSGNIRVVIAVSYGKEHIQHLTPERDQPSLEAQRNAIHCYRGWLPAFDCIFFPVCNREIFRPAIAPAQAASIRAGNLFRRIQEIMTRIL
jgi:hypothetical protein